MKKVFCIIVHFGSHHATDRLVSQLLEGSAVPQRVIVIDQAGQSYRPSITHSPLHISRVTNNGYAAGIAHGLDIIAHQAHEADIVIACNNDVQVRADTIQLLQQWWVNQHHAILAGAKMGAVDLLTGRAHINHKQAPLSLPYIHGSCMVATWATWQSLRPLPEEYFMYWEDVAISIKARQRGIQLRALPDIGLQHDDSLSLRTTEQLYFLVRNGASLLETKTPGVWPVYWQMMNELRSFYHHFAGHKQITRALADRTSV